MSKLFKTVVIIDPYYMAMIRCFADRGMECKELKESQACCRMILNTLDQLDNLPSEDSDD